MSGKGPRKVIGAKQDAKGNISYVLLEGNQNHTSLDKAIEMAKQGKLSNVHSVSPQNGKEYLRSNPDGKTQNNLDEMAED